MNRYLLIFCFVGFSLGQLARIDFGNGIAFTVLDIAVSCFVGYNMLPLLRIKQAAGVLKKPIILFGGACILSLLVNSYILNFHELAVSSLYLIRWMVYAGLYFIIVNSSVFKKDEILQYFSIAGCIHIILGLLQYFLYPDLRQLYFLGWDDHLYRLVGPLIDPNFQGALFVLFFTLFFLLLWNEKKKYRSLSFLSKLLVLIVLMGVIVLTYSRSALLMLGISFVSLGLLLGNKKIIFSFVVITLFCVVLFSNSKIEGLNPFRTASILARISSMQEAITIIRDNPLFGVGFNAFRYAQHRYGFRTSEVWQTSHADAGTDNSYLFVFATAGIIGLGAFVYLLLKILQFLWKSSRRNTMLSHLTLVSFIGLMVDSLFVNSLFYPFFLFWIWMLLGITENK